MNDLNTSSASGFPADSGHLASLPTPQTRRDFLRTAAVAGLGLSLAGCRTVTDAAVPGFIDAHVHVWSPDLVRYPIHSSFQAADMQPASFTPEQLFAHTRPNGVARIVLIQMSFYQFDHRYLFDALERFPGVFSAVGMVDETAPELRRRLQELRARGVRGLRITPGTKPVGAWLESAGMMQLWRDAADLGLAVCPLINPPALPFVGAMCQRFPGTRVVIDHFARIGVDGRITSEQVEALCRLAEFPRVWVKTSAFYALGRKQPPYLDLGPMIRRLRDTFGAERLMWASDCPYQVDPGHTYADSLALIRERLDFLTASDREWLLRRTAERVFFS